MKQELDPIEDTALELSGYYQKASEEIEAEAMKLVRRFQNRHGLSEREAWKLLTKGIPPEDLDAIIEELKKDPKNRDLVAQLESQAYAARINQLRETQAAADSVVASIYRQAQPMMAEALEEITRRSYYENLFGIQQQAGFGWGVPPLDLERVRSIVNQPWSGKSFSSLLWNNTEQLAERVKEQIVVGVLTGKTPHKMVQAIEGEFHAGARNARRLIRTEASYAANEIQRQTYEDLGIERYIYVAILDLRTSEICRSLDMKRFPVAEARVGDPLHPYPPMHPYCRSTTIADLGDEWLSDMKRIALDPATGKVIEVPLTMTYQEWYDIFVKGGGKLVAQGPRSLMVPQQPGTSIAERVSPRGAQQYTDEELASLNRYFSAESYTINEKLRNGIELTEFEQKTVENLDSAIEKAPKYEGEVYRSITSGMIKDLDAFWAEHVSGGSVSYPAYTSTSTEVYDEAFDIQFKIISKTGADLRDLNIAEQEVLFARDVEFKVLYSNRETGEIWLEEM